MLTEKKISVIPIAYKDEGNVEELYRRVTEVMREVTHTYEIIYVNDGSPDQSLELLREIAARDPRVTVISHARNFGPEMAFSTGLRYCTGDAAILLDGDLQDPPELFPAFVSKWLQGYDVVYGQRTTREEGWAIETLRKLFYRLMAKMAYIKVPSDAGDFSLLDRCVVDALNTMPERERFLRGMRAWVGFKQVGVPYHRRARFDGRKASSSLRGYFKYAKQGLFSFSHVPLEILGYLGMFFTIISFLLIIGYVTAWLFLPPAYSPPGLITLYLLILFFGGVQLLSLSIIGGYIGTIFDESKKRPHAVIAEIMNDYRNWLGSPKPRWQSPIEEKEPTLAGIFP